MRKDMKEDVNEVSKYYTGEKEKIHERRERKTRSRMCNGIREGGSKLQNWNTATEDIILDLWTYRKSWKGNPDIILYIYTTLSAFFINVKYT